MELKDLMEEEEIKVINKDLFIIHKHTKERKEANKIGCQYLESKLIEIDNNKIKIKQLEEEIKNIKIRNKNNYEIIGDLYRLGFCDLSEKYYYRDKLTGKISGEYLGHNKMCRNNEKGGNK